MTKCLFLLTQTKIINKIDTQFLMSSPWEEPPQLLGWLRKVNQKQIKRHDFRLTDLKWE
ncbi:hypothetical protein C2G38_2116934 [Gigaspora rosea]|uniref:Uncharacterized protein n=1 Tax=Gigaspora rosea TaxID=44941 RepID=A0A397UAJ0_9GLOM|nr:hypothetical protein C2G38_2116934 [Gigaspora rosea]